MNAQAIGIFDSGLGGLSVWQELFQQLPHESVIYVADSGYCPYGSRPQAEIERLSDRIVRFLRGQACKLIVVACNTATAAAIADLRARYDLPFVGMEPAIKPAARATRSGVIGILATRGTFAGQHFQHSRTAYAHDKEVVIQEGQGLVELVERGQTRSLEAYRLLERYLQPMLQAGADQVVLGCSHYPFLRETMQEILAGRAEIVNPAPAVVRQVARLLTIHDLAAPPLRPSTHTFYTTGQLADLQRMVREIVSAEQYDALHFWRMQLSW